MTLWQKFQSTVRLVHRDIGASPDWTTQPNATGAPQSADDGVDLDGAIKALVYISMDTATQCTAQIWALPGGVDSADRPTEWVHVNGGAFDVEEGGLLERATTSGLERIYVEIVESDGDVDVAVGPGVME